MWPGLVGKKSMGGAEPDLSLDTMLDRMEAVFRRALAERGKTSR